MRGMNFLGDVCVCLRTLKPLREMLMRIISNKKNRPVECPSSLADHRVAGLTTNSIAEMSWAK